MRPTPEQLSSLSRFERAAFNVADLLSQPKLSPVSAAWNSVVMGALIWSCGSRRLNVQGLEHVSGLGKKDSVMLVANHRSFFDFFSITAILYWRTQLTKRIFFPVRSNFFYDHPLGPPVNFAMSGMRMFPPVMREKEKKGFNHYSVSRCIEELNRPDVGTVLGLHPEGKRNKSEDPYAFLPAQPGVGRIALGCTRAKVIPVFVLGMGQSIPGEVRMNVFAANENPVDMYFGPPIDFSDLAPKANKLTTQMLASERCLDAIRDLAEKQRHAAAVRDGRDPEALEPLPRSRVRVRAGANAAQASAQNESASA